MANILLDVPFHSQLLEIQDEYWKVRSCGVACVKMILDFYDKKSPVLEELVWQGVRLDGFGPSGWTHDSLIRLLDIYGVKAERREYKVVSPSIPVASYGVFAGSTVATMLVKCAHRALKLTMRRFIPEASHRGILDASNRDEDLFKKGPEEIEASLQNGTPVMVSAIKQWKEEKKFHLFLLVGMDEEGGFYYHDPDSETVEAGKNLLVSREIFEKYWRRLAIFPVGK